MVVHLASFDKRKTSTLEKDLLELREELEVQLIQLGKLHSAYEPDPEVTRAKAGQDSRSTLHEIEGDVQAEEQAVRRTSDRAGSGRMNLRSSGRSTGYWRLRDLSEQHYAHLKPRAS